MAHVEALGERGVFDEDTGGSEYCGGASAAKADSSKNPEVPSWQLDIPKTEKLSSGDQAIDPRSSNGVPMVTLCPCCFDNWVESNGSGMEHASTESPSNTDRVALGTPPIRSSPGPSADARKSPKDRECKLRRNLSLVIAMLDQMPEHWGQRFDWKQPLIGYPSTLILNWAGPGYKPLSWENLFGDTFETLDNVNPQLIFENYDKWKDHLRLRQIFKGVLIERLPSFECGQLREAYVQLREKGLTTELSVVEKILLDRLMKCSTRELLESNRSDEQRTIPEAFAKTTTQEILRRAPAMKDESEFAESLRYLCASRCSDPAYFAHFKCALYYLFLDMATFWYRHETESDPNSQLISYGFDREKDVQLFTKILKVKYHNCNCQFRRDTSMHIGEMPIHFTYRPVVWITLDSRVSTCSSYRLSKYHRLANSPVARMGSEMRFPLA